MAYGTVNTGAGGGAHSANLVTDTDGVHGMRYNSTTCAFEVYNESRGDWEDASSGTTGGSFALASVTEVSVQGASGQAYIKWTDPEDIVVAGSTLSKWAGTLLIRKAGSAPVSRMDGTIVIDSKTKNAYSTTTLCDSGLTNGVTYYYRFFPYSDSGTYTADEESEYKVTPGAVAMADVTGISATASGNGKLTIKWTDPAATVVENGITVATWGKTIVVVKAGSYATSPDDSAAAFVGTSTTRNAYTTNGMVASGLTNGTTYYVSIFPVSTDGAVNTNTTNRVTGVANRVQISSVPSQSGSLTYTGSALTPAWSNYDSTKMTLGGTTTSTNAGTYSATFTPADDYCWSDNTTAAKIVSWTIGKATGSLTVSASALTLNTSALTGSITLGGNYDGTVTVASSNTSVATVSRSGTAVTVSNVNQTTGTATVTVSVAAGTNYTAPASKTIAVTAAFVTIYGAQWAGGSSTAWSRTDASANFIDPVPAVSSGNGSSPFDNIYPWSGIARVTDSTGGELVSIPKFWYKWTKSGTTLKLQIADSATTGYFVSPAHADRGDGKGERDVVYAGRYHSVSGYKSTTGAAQLVSITRATARSGCSALGSTFWQSDYAMRITIEMLYLVEFADWDSQTKIGHGCSASGSKANNGQTDSMTYHTGTTASARTSYGYTQYRYMEGLWDNVYDWMDGCYYNSSGLNVIMNPSSFSDTTGGTCVGLPTSGYPSAMSVGTASGFEWAMYPTTSSGSATTYVPDYWYFVASYPCLFVGGSYSQSTVHGLFYVSYDTATYTSTYIGCRLMKLP